VKPIGAATSAIDSTTKPATDSSLTPIVPPADGTFPSGPAVKPTPTTPVATATPVAPQAKSSTIGSLPKAFGAEISRTLQSLSGKSTPVAPNQGH
jgi:hypothetical protein